MFALTVHTFYCGGLAVPVVVALSRALGASVVSFLTVVGAVVELMAFIALKN